MSSVSDSAPYELVHVFLYYSLVSFGLLIGDFYFPARLTARLAGSERACNKRLYIDSA